MFLLNCAQCHAASGAGGMLSHGYVVPSVRGSYPTQVAEAVRVGPRPMPTFGPGQLTNQQVSAIADYVHIHEPHSVTPGGSGSGISGRCPRVL